jgi:hypothetical protein
VAAAEGVIFTYFMMARFVGAVEWHEGLHPFLEEAKKNKTGIELLIIGIILKRSHNIGGGVCISQIY